MKPRFGDLVEFEEGERMIVYLVEHKSVHGYHCQDHTLGDDCGNYDNPSYGCRKERHIWVLGTDEESVAEVITKGGGVVKVPCLMEWHGDWPPKDSVVLRPQLPKETEPSLNDLDGTK